MPLLKLETSVSISDEKKAALMSQLSRLTAEIIGKPEQYVMVALGPTEIIMGGQPGKAAFVDLRSIGGLGSDTNRRLTEAICDVLEAELQIAPERIYVAFTDVKASDWGWNGETFG